MSKRKQTVTAAMIAVHLHNVQSVLGVNPPKRKQWIIRRLERKG